MNISSICTTQNQQHSMRKFYLLVIAILCASGLFSQTITYPGGAPAFCPGGSLLLTASNPGPITVSWEYSLTGSAPWTFLTTATTHSAISAGYYRIFNTTPTTVYYDTLQLTLHSVPSASFVATPANQCGTVPVYFTNTSTGGATYLWNFGDPNSGANNTSTLLNPNHRFVGTPGNVTQTFTVTLTVTSAFNCTATTTRTITTTQLPDATLGGPGYGIYNSKKYFKICTNAPSGQFDFFNSTSTTATNTNYQIIWGDGSPDFNAVIFPPPPFIISHTYPVGTTDLKFIVTGQNGCKDTTIYSIFLGSNPSLGLENPGNTSICTGSTLTFPITGTASHPPGTVYTVTFNDGSAVVNLPFPAPASVSHTFNTTSCGTSSSIYSNSFSATIQASNACASSSAIVVPIYVSQKSIPTFGISANDTVCVSNNVTFTNNTGANNEITGGSCIPGKFVWQITPSTGWTVVSGTLGNNFNSSNTNFWITGTTPLVINFNTPGNYSIKLLTGNTTCLTDSVTRTICVNPAPVAAFNIGNTTGCSPLTVLTTNNSNAAFCGPNIYNWSVTYSSATGCLPNTSSFIYLNGTNANSANPEFQFINPGTYVISLITISPGATCSSAVVTRTVVVKDKPNVTLANLPAICQGQTVNPTATVSCFLTAATTYAWTFANGTPATSNLPVPGPITFSTPGNHDITLSVTNECGTSTVTRPLVVNPVPDLTVPAAASFCVGETAGPFVFTSTTTGATFTWTNSNTAIGLGASGNGNIPAFVTTNITTLPISGTVTVTASNGLCTSQQSFAITVNPRPLAPAAVSPVAYCQNATAVALTATATAGNTLLWYTVSTGGTGSATAPIPSTATLGTTIYYVSQVATATNCEGPRTPISIVVKPVPVIAAISSTNPATCGSASGSITLTVLIPLQPYIVHYLKNGVPFTVSLTANASGTIVISNLTAGLYSDFYVDLNGCNSNLMGPVTLSDPSQPATPTATSNGPLCSGGTLNFNASSATAGAAFSWTGPNGFASLIANPSISNVTLAANGNYFVTATLNGCVSVAGSVAVVINPTPILPTASNNGPLCQGNSLNLLANTSTAGVITYAWTGPGSYTSTQQNPVIPNAGLAESGTYTVIATATTNGQACTSAAASTIVLIKPVPQIIDSSFTNPTNCASATGTIILRGLTANILYTVNYTKNGIPQTPVNITAGTTSELVITGLTQGTYSNIFVVLAGCSSNIAGPFTLIDPFPPLTPVVTGSNPVCSGNTILLTANTGSAGAASYLWSGPAGFTSTNPNPTIPNATVANSGNYQVTVTINSCTSAPAAVNVLVNQTPAVPSVISNSPVCTGNTLTFTSATSTAGAMTYAWNGPNGFTSTLQNPTITGVTLANAGTYNVVYTSVAGNCPSAQGSTTVVINPTPAIVSGIPTNPSACGSATGNIQLTGLTAGITYTVNFTFNSATQTITALANATGVLTILNLSAGLYDNIVVVLAGCTSNIIGPISLVDPNPPAAPVASSNSAICAGQTLFLFATATSPGAATYNWTGPNGFNSTTQNPVLNNAGSSNAGYYYVTNTIANCVSLADSVLVVINPIGILPVVISPVNYCIGTAAVALTATANAGNTLNWYSVATGGTPLPSAPVPSTTLAGTTSYYVSQTTSFGCEGPRSQIDVTINPDARALFIPTDTMKCAPFVITTAIVGLQQFPANNATYEWYANGLFIGSGTNFPGYTILNIDDSVTIKLKTISPFGCKADSMSRKFYTFKVPAPSFTLSDTVGCGPLSVTFFNTTPQINLYNYSWDFGNGQTSTLQQPGTILFPINPTYNDTVYTIKLKVTSICDTVTFERQVRVKAPPRALFTPSRTTGCSPMKVLFTNTSLALNNTYYWDFGDGSNLVTTSRDTFTHTFTTGVVDTFTVQLIAVNDCGADTIRYLIVAAPNNIQLNYSVNGPDNFGCAPHTVAFINNSSGASSFEWNFGDGNSLSTTANIDTVYHTYVNAGTYPVSLMAINTCTDTTAFKFITVYPKPTAAFVSNAYTVCIGQAIQLTNQSANATTYAWNFGDGNTSVLVNPSHTYNTSGLYIIRLISFRNNPSGDICIDTAFQQVQVRDTLPGLFSMSDSVSNCAPLTVIFVNRNRPSVTANWNFGDGSTATGDSVVHTFSLPGTFYVNLLVTVPGGCTYQSQDTVTVLGPSGNLQYNAGFVCSPNAVMFTAAASNANSYVWNFGDGNTATTSSNIIYHTYANPGNYVPSVSLQNITGCSFFIQGLDTIKVDKITAGFTWAAQQRCGSTAVQFTDTSSAFFGIANVDWRFGDGTTGTGNAINHTYTASNLYNVEMILTSNSGCADTISTPVNIHVNSIPVASIIGDIERCANELITFSANIVSTDPLTVQQWTMSNGVTANGPSFSYLFNLPGTYNIRFISGTAFGCFDTAFHTILIKPVPFITATNSLSICLGNTAQLNVTGAANYQWNPAQGLSCTTCSNPIASPLITTPYVVTASNAFGCAAYDTVVVTVIQPMNLTVSPNDSICIGESANLLATGATTYAWNPGATLSSITVANPVATPIITTSYRVVGYDGFNCFTDTAFVVVAVGRYPTVNLGPDLILSTGTLHPLITTVTNGPIAQWLWSPALDLSCANCPLPVANIKKDISYIVKVTTGYGCSATDTISIKVFCEDSQVFIPNAFTPDGDGINDVLMVRGKGIVSVKFFRVFNRWGELVFERSNFPPNVVSYGWNGKVRGITGPPDVFVYTAEVVCENGSTYVYKGNTSIIK